MKTDEFVYAIKNLLHRKVRSWLTVLSILIGVMAIFSIISFGLGIRNYMDVLSSQAGSDKLFIQSKGMGAPGTSSSFFISRDDVDFVSKISGVADIAPIYMKPVQVGFRKENKYTFMLGYDVTDVKLIEETASLHLVKGRGLRKGETGKVVLGYNYQVENKVFKKAVSLGDKIQVNGNDFQVVGFYNLVGNPQDDSEVYMTSQSFESLFPDQKDKFGYVMIKSQPGVDPQALADKIQEKLRKHKGEDKGKEDFYVQTFADILQTFGTIINVLNGILLLIAAISMIVAFVNIMNTMYTAVLERTKEIGVMKAVGARNSDILFIFVLESGLLGMVGGILGVVLGFFISTIGGGIAAAYGYSLLTPIFPWYLILGCILFSFIVGALAGLLPAYQASKLKPVDSLRYE